MSLAIVGAGSWGTALAIHLSRGGESIRLWCREADLVEVINRGRENPWFLPGCPIPARVDAVAELEATVAGAEAVIVAVPSEFFGAVIKDAVIPVAPAVPIISAGV